MDKESAATVESSIDELIRHHPNLKKTVFDPSIATLEKVEELGTSFIPPENIQHFYRLSMNAATSEDVDMRDEVPVPATTEAAASETRSENESAAAQDESQTRTHDNLIINFIDVIRRVSFGPCL